MQIIHVINTMMNIICWSLFGVPLSYGIIKLFNLSGIFKYAVITLIMFFSFLKGWTGNDLLTNIQLYKK